MTRKPLSKVTRRRILALAVMGVLVLGLLVAARIAFPGQQTSIALRLATGVGIPSLQARIDALEEKAIRRGEFTQEDKAFLLDFYTCLATGARLTVILRQSGGLMEHYLEGTGEPLALRKGIFTRNWKVQRRMRAMRGTIVKAARAGKPLEKRYVSGTFHMPHPSVPDSVFGLYHGTLEVRPRREDGRLVLSWRAEVPWQWPSYASLERKYGDPHAESFPLPNPLCLFGPEHALRVDNGLGEHLVQIGLARPFIAYAEWEEVVRP